MGTKMTTKQLAKKDPACCGSGCSAPISLTLPVAPRTIARIRFEPLEEKARAVPPRGALNWVEEHLRAGVAVRSVDLDGPGDPLAEISLTEETLNLLREKHPEIVLSLSTLGINAENYAGKLKELGVRSVTLLVDAVDHEVANKLYAWIRPDKKTIPLAQATAMLLEEQTRAVAAFKGAGCTVNIRTTVYPGINDGLIGGIAKAMAIRGAEKMVLVPYTAPADPGEKVLSEPDVKMMAELLHQAAEHIETIIQVEKEGGLGTGCSSPHGGCESVADRLPAPTKKRPNVAVVSSNGMEVDLHLGQAYQVLVYGPREDGLPCLLETRPVPEPGSGSSRWQDLADILDDCFAILTASAGESPRRILGEHGITVLITESEIEGSVDQLYGGGKKKKC